MDNPLKRIYYIYTLTCPIDNIVRYVGCSINPRNRFSAHINCCGGGFKKSPWIKNLRDQGLLPILSIVKSTEIEEEAVILECEIYDIFKSEYMVCEDPKKKKYIDTAFLRKKQKYEYKAP